VGFAIGIGSNKGVPILSLDKKLSDEIAKVFVL
jgi:hypothetical protein